MRIIIKKSSIKQFFKLLIIGVIFLQIYNFLMVFTHEMGHALYCEYIIWNHCKVTKVRLNYYPLKLSGNAITQHLSENQWDLNNSKNYTPYNNLSYQFEKGKDFIIFTFKFRDINNTENLTPESIMTISESPYKNVNISFKEKLKKFYYINLVTLMGPIFQILFLIIFIRFLKLIYYPLNVIVPIILWHSLIHTGGILNEVAWILNLMGNYTYYIYYMMISWIIIIVSIYICNKKIFRGIHQ